jgi:hypothetical protein
VNQPIQRERRSVERDLLTGWPTADRRLTIPACLPTAGCFTHRSSSR